MLYNIYSEFIKRNKLDFLIFCFSFIHIPLSKVGLPHVYGELISNLKTKKMNKIKLLFMKLIGIWSFIKIFDIISEHYDNKLIPKFHNYVRSILLDKIFTKYENQYEELKTGEIILKMNKIPGELSGIFWLAKDLVFKNTIVVLSTFFYLFYYNKNLGWIYLVCMIFIYYISYRFNNQCKKNLNIFLKNINSIYEDISDTLSNLMSVYVAKNKDYEKEQNKKKGEVLSNYHNKVKKCYQKYKVIFTILFILIFIILNYYTFSIYYKKKINDKTLISIVIINYSILTNFMMIYGYTKRFIDMSTKINLILEYFEELNNKKNKNNKNNIKNENMNDLTIEIQNLSYKINNNLILDNINLTINNNDNLLIMGHIGSGKSTLAKILVKLYNNYQGSIKINNYELKYLDVQSVRSLIYYIPQHPMLFNRTLFENIIYGSKNVSVNDINLILDKLDMNNLKNKFNKLMYETVGKGGSRLSGGQKQIVYLLRAILINSKILIIDEPSASLDEINKNKLIKFLDEYTKDKTVLIISHDESFKKISNKVIILKNGIKN